MTLMGNLLDAIYFMMLLLIWSYINGNTRGAVLLFDLFFRLLFFLPVLYLAIDIVLGYLYPFF